MSKRVYHIDGKHPTLMTITGGHQKGNITNGKDNFFLDAGHCDVLQGFKYGYTDILKESQRRSLLGDGWTLPIIIHILSFMDARGVIK